MANEHLKNALRGAGLTIEQFAEIINVDPKTVQRWVAGRTPYPRHRATIARALDLPEHELWPRDVQPPAADSERERLTAGEVTGSWGHSNDPGAPEPITFLSEGADRIEILDAGGALLQAPGLLDALRDRAFDGSEVRVLPATPHKFLADRRGIEVRIVNASPGLALLRADDTMLLAITLDGASPPALVELRRHDRDGLFDRLADHFQSLWDQAPIAAELRQSTEPTLNDDGRASHGRDPQSAGPHPGDERSVPVSPAAEPAPRRWPRRPN